MMSSISDTDTFSSHPVGAFQWLITSSIKLTHIGSYMSKGLFVWRRVTRLTELPTLPGNSPSIENYRFPSEMFTCRKHSPWRVPGGEAGSCPGKMNILPCKCFAQETQQAWRNFCQQHMPVFSFHVKVEVLHVTTVYLTYECRVTRFHINRALVCPDKASNLVNRATRLHINRP